MNLQFYAQQQQLRTLLESIGGLSTLQAVCEDFYQEVFKDPLLSVYVANPDLPHAERLATFIAEYMGAGPVWSSNRPFGARSRSHSAAMACPKRGEQRFAHFSHDDARRWTQLMAQAAVQHGLHENEVFWLWFEDFVEMWIGIYKTSAQEHVHFDFQDAVKAVTQL